MATTPAPMLSTPSKTSGSLRSPARPGEGRDQREHAVDQGVGSEERHEDAERETGPDPGQHAEENGQHAAQHERPPVAGDHVEHRFLLRSDAPDRSIDRR
jgi:hypothetical protein